MTERRARMTPKQVVRRLERDGWTLKRKGPGDHRQFVHASKPGKVTVDMGVDVIPPGTLRSVFCQAGWPW